MPKWHEYSSFASVWIIVNNYLVCGPREVLGVSQRRERHICLQTWNIFSALRFSPIAMTQAITPISTPSGTHL
jgi:hypothetical protein